MGKGSEWGESDWDWVGSQGEREGGMACGVRRVAVSGRHFRWKSSHFTPPSGFSSVVTPLRCCSLGQASYDYVRAA